MDPVAEDRNLQLGFQQRAEGPSTWDYRGGERGVNFPPESTILVEEADGSGIKNPILHTTGNSKEGLRDFLLGIIGGRGISSPQSQIFWQKNFIDPASKDQNYNRQFKG